MTLTQKVSHWVLWTILLGTVGQMMLWYFFPVDPMTISEASIEFKNKEDIVPGGILLYSVSIEKHLPVPGEISRVLIECSDDGSPIVSPAVYTLKGLVGDMPVGRNLSQVSIDIPDYVIPGKMYKVRTSVQFKVNPMIWWVERYTTPCFWIRHKASK